ncbi:MAG TPA: Flp family type IVb pilin [Hyphomonadaceae bacterium]|jgi:pilus assembly protein Flp/PilA|nr:Flp family type IVb pilin [Hyphomonadaceae bacterium]HPN06436.1 Flp family type IVb pilin [Hyphomonadaceae bacterium]
MKNLKKLLRVIKDRSGATVIEYCLIAGIISLAIIGGATILGSTTNDAFTTVKTKVWGA